jgi:large subunit ribosomal protein L32
MAVPKKRTSKSRKRMRRAHDFITPTAAVMLCPDCGEMKLMHHVCPNCGAYRGRSVLASAAVEIDDQTA